MTIIYILAIFSLAVYVILLAELSRRKRRRRRSAPSTRHAPGHPAIDLHLPEDPCDRCLRWGECNGVAKGGECPWT